MFRTTLLQGEIDSAPKELWSDGTSTSLAPMARVRWEEGGWWVGEPSQSEIEFCSRINFEVKSEPEQVKSTWTFLKNK
jgi:hypothetical protein